MATARTKVLLVSENLGTPSFRRTWHDYSVACLEHLKAAGAEVTLVVERAFGFESGSRPGAVNDEARLTALYEYLLISEFDPRLFYRGILARLLALYAPTVLRALANRQHRRAMALEVSFPNRPREAGGIPNRLDYLREVDRFLFPRRFYSAANLRAVYDTGPAEVDATGYDLVVIDGLLPVRITGVSPVKVVTIVHDMSAVAAPDTRMKVRLIAGQALLQMAKNRGIVLFATDDARQRFDRLAGSEARRSALVLGRLVSNRVRRLASGTPAKASSEYMSSLEATARKSAFLRSVSAKGILDRLARDLAGDPCPTLGVKGQTLSPETPTVVFVWPAGLGIDIRPITKLAADLTGFANVIALGAKVPPVSSLPKPDIAPAQVIEFPVNLVLSGDLPERDRLDVLRHATLVVYPDRAGAGAKLLEAIALGAMIVCFDHPANRELIGEAPATFISLEASSLLPAILAALSQSNAASSRLTRQAGRESLLAAPSSRAFEQLVHGRVALSHEQNEIASPI